MSTALEIVESALNHLGVHSEVANANQTVKDACFKHLRSVLARLAKNSIILEETDDLGVTTTVSIPDLLSDEINEPLAATENLSLYLGADFAPKARIQITPPLTAAKKESYSELVNIYRQVNVPLSRPSSLLHKGSGNRSSGRYGNDWFNGERLDSDTT